jgi:hypothetical protein
MHQVKTFATKIGAPLELDPETWRIRGYSFGNTPPGENHCGQELWVSNPRPTTSVCTTGTSSEVFYAVQLVRQEAR